MKEFSYSVSVKQKMFSPLKKLCTTLKGDIFDSWLVLNVQLCVDTVSQSSLVQMYMFATV